MVVEERDYRVKAGFLSDFLEAYRDEGLAIQLELLGSFHGYFTSEIGELNHVVAWWSYDSFDDRMARRGTMMADPRWQQYLKRVKGMLEVQSSRILVPTAFSPLR